MKGHLIRNILLKDLTPKISLEKFLNQKILKNGISVILVYILIFLPAINHISAPLGATLLEIFLVGKKPCYLLGEGYVKTFKELMNDTEWDKYGTGNYDKCSDCMAHCGYEASAVTDVFANPLKALSVALKGPKTEGVMAKEIDISNSRDPDFFHDAHVSEMMSKLHAQKRMKQMIHLFHQLVQL